MASRFFRPVLLVQTPSIFARAKVKRARNIYSFNLIDETADVTLTKKYVVSNIASARIKRMVLNQ